MILLIGGAAVKLLQLKEGEEEGVAIDNKWRFISWLGAINHEERTMQKSIVEEEEEE